MVGGRIAESFLREAEIRLRWRRVYVSYGGVSGLCAELCEELLTAKEAKNRRRGGKGERLTARRPVGKRIPTPALRSASE
jgi:hypothetical protein